MSNENLSRRTFLKGTTASLAGVSLYGMSYDTAQEKPRYSPKKSGKKSEYHFMTCPRNCRDACSLIAEIQDGLMVDIKGNPNHPVTRGHACVKGNLYREYLYQPNRILHPMKRVGKRAEGKWERISWDEAFKYTAKRLQKVIDKYGGEAIGEMVYSGNEAFISKSVAPGNFFEKIGATRLQRNPCDWPRYNGTPSVIGTPYSKDMLETKESDLYVSWGSNEAYTAVHWAYYGQRVRRNGGKMVVINTIRTPMANNADMFIQLEPSSDPFFCLGVCKVLIEENLCDYDFIKKYAIGFEDLKKQTQEYTLDELAKPCGITKKEIVKFARMYAKAKRPAIAHGDGGQRHMNGSRICRAVTFLPVLVGALTKKGAGLFWAYTDLGQCYDYSKVMPDLSPKGPDGKKIERQTNNYIQFGRAMRLDNPTSFNPDVETYEEVKIKPMYAAINYNTSLMTCVPNTNLIKKRLMEDDDFFLLVLDPFHTDTVDYADIVMPAGTFLESEDVQNDQISGFVCYNSGKAELVGESKNNLQIFNGIARAMGFKDECFTWDDPVPILKKMLDTEFNRKQGITYERLVKEGQIKPIRNSETMEEHFPYYPYYKKGDWKFKTPSEKIELYSKRYKEWGYNPVIDLKNDRDWYRAQKQFGDKYLKEYPLCFMTPGTQLQNNSNWGSNKYIVPRVLVDGYPEIFMCKEDANKRRVKNGDVIKAFNEKGDAYFRVHITTQVKPGIVYAWNNLWTRTTKTKTGANMLCSDEISDLHHGSTFTATYVEVKKH